MKFDCKISYDNTGNKVMTLELEGSEGTKMNITQSEVPILLSVLKDVTGTIKANSAK